MDKSRVEPTIFFIEKYNFLRNFFLVIFMGNPSLRLSEVLSLCGLLKHQMVYPICIVSLCLGEIHQNEKSCDFCFWRFAFNSANCTDLDEIHPSEFTVKIPDSNSRLLMENYFFLLFNQNICCGYSKEPSQWCWKVILLITQPKYMLWVLKRTVSMRRFFWAPKTHI